MNTTEKPLPTYIVQTSSASMPSSCWGRYRNVAILKLVPGTKQKPPMISDRCKTVEKIMWHSGPQFEGTTDRCAYAKSLAWAKEYAEELNSKEIIQ